MTNGINNSRIDKIWALIFAAICCVAGIGLLASGTAEEEETALRVLFWIMAIGGGLWTLSVLAQLGD